MKVQGLLVNRITYVEQGRKLQQLPRAERIRKHAITLEQEATLNHDYVLPNKILLLYFLQTRIARKEKYTRKGTDAACGCIREVGAPAWKLAGVGWPQGLDSDPARSR
jgi:hypothetical protein